MRFQLSEAIQRILKAYKQSHIWRRVVNTLACFVVFCTTYALILPAITMETVTFCGLEEHQHTQECYVRTEAPVLICDPVTHTHVEECYAADGSTLCGVPAFFLHTHGALCFDGKGTLVCPLPELEPHIHADSCYAPVETLPQETALVAEGHTHGEECFALEQGNLVCQLSGEDYHLHGDTCWSLGDQSVCGLEEGADHAHGETCYEKTLTCTLEERPRHLHTDACYEQNAVQICELEEAAPVYETLPTAEAAEPVLVCTVTDPPRHDHGESCVYQDNTLTCQLAEGEGHTHTELCYGSWQLVCEKEEHTHVLACSSDPHADLETAAQWESTFAHVELTDNWNENILLIAQTQLGYTESALNYAVWPDDTVHGYTRYGDWYGMAHADWCGMFVSFCMDYAGVEEVPLNYGVRPWIDELSGEDYDLYRLAEEYTPVPGDLVFFDWEDDGLSDHVGIVCELIEATEEEPAKIKTIEGNSANRVRYVTYELEDPCLLGYGDMAAAQERYERLHSVIQTAQTENYIVTVTYSTDLVLPEGAQLQVMEYAKDSEIFRQRCEEAGYELEWLLNIGFFLDGEELDLDGEFDVVVTNKQGTEMGESVIHFADDGAQRIEAEDSTAEAEEGQSSVSFSSDGFSDFGGIAPLAETANTAAISLYFTTVNPNNLVEGKNYAIYCIVDGNCVFLTSLEDCPALTVSGMDSTKPVTDGETWTLTAEQVGGYSLAGLSWQLELPTDGSAYKRLFSVGYNDPVREDGTEEYPGPEYLCFKKDDLQTWFSEGIIDLNITPSSEGAGAYIQSIETNGLTQISYDPTQEDSAKWRAVASTGTATTVYFAEVTEVCDHTYTYIVTDNSGCGVNGSVTYTCSKCNESGTVNASTVASSVISYANSLRTANTIGGGVYAQDDYSKGKFSWDTESKDRGWTYYNGVMLDAFMEVGTQDMVNYVVDFYDDVLEADGTPKGYISGEVDSVPMALALFDLLSTGDSAENVRYEAAIQYVFDQLWNKQTVLGSEYGGNFWHKEVESTNNWYTWRFGLDGIYMALPFLVEYANALDDGRLTNDKVTAAQIYQDVTNRLKWVADTMYDSKTQLYHHGWNGTSGNGQFWGRGIGWYAVALVDIIDMMPSGYSSQLTDNLPKLFDGMLKYQDPETGMWYNVVNYDDTLSYTTTVNEVTTTTYNKLETSVSSMMAYAMMKAYNEGFVTDAKYYGAGLRALNGVVTNKMQNGSVVDTYKSSGVTTVASDYLKNGYTTNEAKGVGALILAAAPDHNWSAWAVSEAQTASEDGTFTETRSCTVCGATQTRTVTTAESAPALMGYEFTVVDPTQLEHGKVYAIYANPDPDNYPDDYVFLMSNISNPGAQRVVTSGYGTKPLTIGEKWTVSIEDLSENEADFTWKVDTQSIQSSGQKGKLWLEALGLDTTRYLSVRNESSRQLQTSPVVDGENNRANYISLTINTTAGKAECTIVNENRYNYYVVLTDNLAGEDDWQTSAVGDTKGEKDKDFQRTDEEVSATPVVFASVKPVYEETPVSSARYQLTTVNPNELKPDTNYVIYTKSGSDDDTYTFLYSTHNLPATTIADTGFTANPTVVGKNWSLTETQMGSTLAAFTWQIEKKENSVTWIAANGYDNTEYDGPEYLCLRYVDNAVQTWFNGGTGEGINLSITNVDGAACNILRADDGKEYQLYYDSAETRWEVQAADGTATTVYFAAVTDTQAPEVEEPEEETYTFQVLGTAGPVEGKKYIIYYPYTTTTTSDDGTSVTRNDVKFLGSLVNPSKNGNYSRGADDVEDDMTSLKQAEKQWTLESSKINDYTVEELKWTVVEIDGDLCLRSVADPTLHLKLVCTNESGASQVNSTDDYEQDAQYFSLEFTSSGDPSDSYYTISTEDGATNLGFYAGNNTWRAIVDGYTPEDSNEVNQFNFYIAEVIEDTTEEEDPGTEDGPTEEQVVGYEFTTLDPSQLKNGDIVSIYLQNEAGGDDYTFMSSQTGLPPIAVDNTGENVDPVTIKGTWEASVTDMGTRSMAYFTWQVVEDAEGNIRLKSMSQSSYLTIYSNEAKLNGNESDNNQLVVDGVNTGNASAQLRPTQKNYYLYFDEETGKWTGNGTATTIYFASVKDKTAKVKIPTNFPEAVSTGSPSVDTLRFYNFAAQADGKNIGALSGCKFVITGTNGYTYTIISGDNPELHLPADIPDGTYTIEEVSASDGYLRDVKPKRTFTVATNEDGQKGFSGDSTIGTFLNHADDLVGADKTAEVFDYNNRTYQIMMSTDSDLRLYQMNPVDVLFVVDQSNSMLFPAGLTPVPDAKININLNTGCTDAAMNPSTTNTSQLEQLVNDEKLSKDQVYYIIADAKVSSTVYALWYNGVDWMYQDSSYYAKAWHNNEAGYRQENEETAIFPEVASYDEQPKNKVTTDENGNETTISVKANGGSLSYEIGGSIKSDIVAANAESLEYTIYTATNGYNRLHYLQDALANAIHELADANPESTVTLIRFTRVTDPGQCIGPLKLTPNNVRDLIYAVENIETSGGTRQDIALEHAYQHLINAEGLTFKDANGNELTDVEYDDYTDKFTVLITDGAPARSSGDTLVLGGAGDPIPSEDAMEGIITTETPKGEDAYYTPDEAAEKNKENGITVYSAIKYYGKQVSGKSTLMTVGLGMNAVEGGAQVLEEIATGYDSGNPDAANPNYMMLQDASQLTDALKQLLFASMAPREKVDLMGDISDVISDSFYPIAYTTLGNGTSTDRKVLYSDNNSDWILLEAGDWITVDGAYAGTVSSADGAFGQLTKNETGDFQITWDNQILYDCELVWVPTEAEVPEGRTIVLREDNLGINSNGNSTVGRYWFSLNPGDYVYAHGEYAGANEGGNKTGTVGYSFLKDSNRQFEVAGQYLDQDGDGPDRPHIVWNNYYNVDFDANFQPYLWNAKFYVKAKEDFIGGNAIDTNKSAGVTVEENDGDTTEDETIGTVTLETPTVNVRLLDMNEHSSEVTVFLGDLINAEGSSPLDSLKQFYDATKFTKLISGDGDVLNAVESADGLTAGEFFLRYAMGRDLTDAEWSDLADGEAINVEYTYDAASSQGKPVGYFTFKLGKSGKDSTTPSYDTHESTAACQPGGTPATADCTAPSEYYHLYVTYTAYELGEEGRPAENLHNGTGSPGTEAVEPISKTNTHEVHVISGKIQITKEITDNLISAEPQTYTFTLTAPNGAQTTHDVTIAAGETEGTLELADLPRGTYTLSETASDNYVLKDLAILDSTNSYSSKDGSTVTFVMGNDPGNTDVISVASGDAYTSYTGTPNGVFGAARFTNTKAIYTAELPVTKTWTGQAPSGAVYLILYKDGNPVKDDSGNDRVLELTADGNWTGKFTVTLAYKDQPLAEAGYFVMEPGKVSDNEVSGWHQAALEGREGEYIWYDAPAQAGGFATVGDSTYVVNYQPNDDGSWTVNNAQAYELPESGGPGTAMYTAAGAGLILLSLALLYIHKKRGKGDCVST